MHNRLHFSHFSHASKQNTVSKPHFLHHFIPRWHYTYVFNTSMNDDVSTQLQNAAQSQVLQTKKWHFALLPSGTHLPDVVPCFSNRRQTLAAQMSLNGFLLFPNHKNSTGRHRRIVVQVFRPGLRQFSTTCKHKLTTDLQNFHYLRSPRSCCRAARNPVIRTPMGAQLFKRLALSSFSYLQRSSSFSDV